MRFTIRKHFVKRSNVLPLQIFLDFDVRSYTHVLLPILKVKINQEKIAKKFKSKKADFITSTHLLYTANS